MPKRDSSGRNKNPCSTDSEDSSRWSVGKSQALKGFGSSPSFIATAGISCSLHLVRWPQRMRVEMVFTPSSPPPSSWILGWWIGCVSFCCLVWGFLSYWVGNWSPSHAEGCRLWVPSPSFPAPSSLLPSKLTLTRRLPQNRGLGYRYRLSLTGPRAPLALAFRALCHPSQAAGLEDRGWLRISAVVGGDLCLLRTTVIGSGFPGCYQTPPFPCWLFQ